MPVNEIVVLKAIIRRILLDAPINDAEMLDILNCLTNWEHHPSIIDPEHTFTQCLNIEMNLQNYREEKYSGTH